MNNHGQQPSPMLPLEYRNLPVKFLGQRLHIVREDDPAAHGMGELFLLASQFSYQNTSAIVEDVFIHVHAFFHLRRGFAAHCDVLRLVAFVWGSVWIEGMGGDPTFELANLTCASQMAVRCAKRPFAFSETFAVQKSIDITRKSTCC